MIAGILAADLVSVVGLKRSGILQILKGCENPYYRQSYGTSLIGTTTTWIWASHNSRIYSSILIFKPMAGTTAV